MDKVALQQVEAWFKQRGWSAFDFQREAWSAYLNGESGLLHAPTGTGKTHAAWFGPILDYLHQASQSLTAARPRAKEPVQKAGKGQRSKPYHEPIRVLWLTPLRALANDTAEALREPIEQMQLPWSIQLRTGDTSQSVRKKQKEKLPTALVTTPESLSLLLSYPDARAKFASLQCVVVDEWHELMGTKRGVQTELGLARLRTWNPQLRTWGLSATMGNLDQAMYVLVGARRQGRLVEGQLAKQIRVETLVPDEIERFPWAGHLGVKLVEEVAQQITQARSTLLFTNTRSQAEAWYEGLLKARPDWLGDIALHHGSLDRKIRSEVEELLRAGQLRAVVCTSSLDLGVDFTPVEQVMQLGSPKGVARMMQRAGRSGHQPGVASTIVGVPTHAFELVEFSAAREAVAARAIEDRQPVRKALDVLAQHVVTVAAGGGFDEWALLEEVRGAAAFADLTEEEWGWVMDFVERGGPTLGAYPRFARVVEQPEVDADGVGCISTVAMQHAKDATSARRGRWMTIASPAYARQHRLGIGTITSDAAMTVQFRNGRRLGTVEESFIARMRAGDRFVFAGRVLELVRVREMAAQVKPAKQKRGTVPRWAGARFPLSTRMAEGVRKRLDEARQGIYVDDEMRALKPLMQMQQQVSRLPAMGELLIEWTTSREGSHWFLYPFVGRLAHEGLGALLAYRLTLAEPRSVAVNVNDYGIELLSPEPIDLDSRQWRSLLTDQSLLDDLLACLNASQMARRQFRDIARIAGLLVPSYPGQPRKARQLQASSDLFFDVFQDFDPDNLLLNQARREVLEEQLEMQRLRAAVEQIAGMQLVLIETQRLSPMAFPLYADRLRQQQLSSEKWSQQVARMAQQLEKAGDQGKRKRNAARAASQ